MMRLDPLEWCIPCGWAGVVPPIPPGLRVTAADMEARRLEWIKNPPRAPSTTFTNTVDPATEQLRDLENQRKEAIKAAKRESLNSFKDEHAERGERWDKKAKAWIRDEKLLRRIREKEFRDHARAISDPDILELQAEPIDARAQGDAPQSRVATVPPAVANVASVPELRGRPESGGTAKVPARSQALLSPARGNSQKGDKRRQPVAMPVVLPPAPPPLK